LAAAGDRQRSNEKAPVAAVAAESVENLPPTECVVRITRDMK